MKYLAPITLLLTLSVFTSSMAAASTVAVEVNGVTGEVLKNVLTYLSINEYQDYTSLTEGRIKQLHDKADKEITAALKPFGYYRPSITKQLNRIDQDKWQAVYNIEPGPPLLIGSLQLDISGPGKSDPEFQKQIEKFPLHVGDILNQQVYESAKSGLIKIAAERGYFDGRLVEHRIEIDLTAYSAAIELHYESGPRYRLGPVRFDQDVLNTDLLQRYIPFNEGDPFDIEKVLDLQQALNDSQYFNDVEINLQRDDILENHEVPVKVFLAPRKRHNYLFGIGYGTDTGARGKIGWEMPRVNARGHRWDSELKLAENGNSLTAGYHIPVFDPRTDELSFTGGVVTEKTDTADSLIRTLGMNLAHVRGDWKENVSLSYQDEDYTIAGVDDHSTLLMPGISWSRIWAEQELIPLVPRFGARLIVDFRGASDGLVSDTSFFQNKTHLKIVVPAGDRNRLLARGTLGTTIVDQFATLPASVRFFTGGSTTVRGYSYNSLGPKDANGEVVGGKYLLVGSLEFEHKFTPRWAWAVFYDIGNAIDDFNDPLKEGAGGGIRWQSPVGPVRLDVGFALSENTRPWEIHFNIGPDL